MLAILKRAAVILGEDGKPNYAALARAIRAPRTALYSWKKIPAAYCLKLELATKGKITTYDMRRDIFPKPKTKTMEMTT